MQVLFVYSFGNGNPFAHHAILRYKPSNIPQFSIDYSRSLCRNCSLSSFPEKMDKTLMDDLAIPPKYPGEVFKTVDNVDVTIENDGEICWKTKEVESFSECSFLEEERKMRSLSPRFQKSSEMQRLYSCYSPAKHTLFLRVFLVVFLLLLTMAISFRLWVTYPIPSRKKPVLRGDYFWDNWRVKRYLRSWGIKGTDWLEQGICPVKCINCDEVKKTCSLDLRREEITHLKWAGGLQITSLNISGKHVSDIGPLASQPIATLDISGTFVSDLGPISSLTNLCSLNFDNTLVSDLGPLAKWAENTGQPHPVLRMLSLRNTRVADLTPLKDIDIERLHLDGIPCDDLSSIRTNLLSVISFSLDPDKEWKGVDHLRACTNIVFLNNLRPSSYSWRLFDFFYSDEVDRSRFSSAPSSWDLSKLYEAKRAACHEIQRAKTRQSR